MERDRFIPWKQSFALALLTALSASVVAGDAPPGLPRSLRTVLDNTKPLEATRGGRLPLWVLPISQSLAGLDDDGTTSALRELDRRGIGYTVAWNHGNLGVSSAEAIRIAALEQRLGMEVAADATGCLMGFFDGGESTLHVDDAGRPFAETSFGGKLGCPFTLDERVPVIRERIEAFLREYVRAGVRLDLAFADWEIDGPIEWNDAWSNSKRCRRCRERIPGIERFPEFQRQLRAIRSELQRRTLAEPVRKHFPRALVGNYAVNPHDGYRYWYDYFEREAGPGVPVKVDQRARYRAWADEFGGTGYTFAMPVIYTWHRNFGWYDFADPDFRWFRSLLLEGSSVGRSTPSNVPIIPFVHWHTTAPPDPPGAGATQFSAQKYQELLWHLLLRGHDTFFLWCLPEELPEETRLVHEVYAESLKYRPFLDRGVPVSFEVPNEPAAVVSGLRLGNRVLVRRTEFGDEGREIVLKLEGGRTLTVPRKDGTQSLSLKR